jgi:GNAT superfamily N-acetyltransferase
MEDEQSRTTIRPARVADAQAIIDLHFAAVHRIAATFYPPAVLDSWSSRPDEARDQRMREVIAGGDELVLVAETASGVVAFASVEPRLRVLRAVYVHPDAGGRGVGSQLLTALERLVVVRGVLELHVDASVNAEAFYQRAGYEVVEYGIHRLATGQDMACVKMFKKLPC